MSKLAVMVVERAALESIASATDEVLPDVARRFCRRGVQIQPGAPAPHTGAVIEALAFALVDAVDSLYETRVTHSGAMHVIHEDIGHETVLAKRLLPLFNGSHLGRLIKQYGGEFLDAHHHAPKRAA